MSERESNRHITEAEDREIESERQTRDLLKLLKNHHRTPKLRLSRNVAHPDGEETQYADLPVKIGVARKKRSMRKRQRRGKKSSSLRKFG